MAKITIYVPEQDPIKVSFDHAEVTIGRAPDNDIVIAHDSISGHHAKLQLVGDTYSVTDLDSTNGIKVEDIATTNGPLTNGTKVTFGKVDAVFECPQQASAGDEDGEDDEDDEDESFGGGEPFASNMEVEIAEASVKPAGFENLSPLEKLVEKDQLRKVAILVGLVAIVSALATLGMAAVMKVG